MRQRVGPYEIVGQIGRGGMAIVYLARQPALGRSVALKELAPFHASEPSLAQRFIREARVAGSLNHPNIVTVLDFLEDDGVPYIAMEYLERGSLRPFVGRLSLPQVAGVLEGLLAALSHAETMGIVHRDVKPENLLVTPDGGVKIADFGIAKAYQDVATSEMLTPAGETVGTPAYMAPEQAMAQGLGPWTDLYQTGVVAYELLAGAVPFQSDTPVAVIMQHISEPLPALPPGTDPALEAWVRRTLAKEPAARHPGAQAAWEELEEIIVEVAGPLWRRDARLGHRDPTAEDSAPLTPAPFSSWHNAVPAADPPAPAPPPAAASWAGTPPPEAATPPPAATKPPAAEPSREAEPPPAATTPPAAPAPPRPTVRTYRPARRRRWAALALGVPVLVAAAAVVLVLNRDGGGDTPAPTATATTTVRPEATVPPGPFAVGEGPDGVAVGAGAVWVASSGEGTLTRVDPRSGDTVSVEVGENPDSVVVAFDSVWVSVTGAGRVVRLSADARPRELDSFEVGENPEGLAASGRSIWVANSGDGSISQIVVSTGTVRTVAGVGGQPVALAVGAGAVWVADAAGGLARVNGGRLALERTITGIGPNPRAVAIIGRDVWVVTADDARAWRVAADDNSVTGSVRVGGQPRDIATDGERLWVTDRTGDRVLGVDPGGMRVAAREPLDGGPLSVAVEDESTLWVTLFDAGDVARIAP
jgi:hypothetical protein